ncbi:ATP-dependent RNA helicase DBP7 [Pseudocercospora fuligena]|uniref:ATP-dependent RNA helicase n=1 Tax=Pseudocercospora fuligena TaxID=685502 RepID=A0A8H6RK27_9PEZI|nr:ATP-dependent RNA helicase DBP7 [Pseudocercospora fuligena]
MADDGLMLNFELPTDAFTLPKTKLKGGSWKDRLTARKSQEYGRKKAQERASAGDVNSARSDRPSKPSEAASSQIEGRPAKRARIGHEVLPKSTNGEVISSLFSFNKTSAATNPVEKVDETPVEPTNAPLKDDETAKFTSLGLSESLANHLLKKLEIRAPTAIQRKAVKQLRENDTDAFLQAQTGSGKTLAYLLPIVERISTISKKMKASGQDFSRDSGLFAIVLAPTRELSKQIASVLEGLLSCYHWIVAGTVIGGEKKKSEKARLRKGLNILVATPGRMVDHLEHTETLDLSSVRWLVLDEGDRLMELGFEQDIQKIISVLNLRSRKRVESPLPGLPDRRTTVLCSATIKASIDQLRSISLKDPVTLAVDADDTEGPGGPSETEAHTFSAPAQLKQSYVIVPPKQRLVTLVAVLKQTFKRKGSVMKCIVFISCADSVDFHFELLTQGEGSAAQEESPPSKRAHKPLKQQSDPKKILQGNTISETRTHGKAAKSISSTENPFEVYRLHGSLQQATRTSTLKAFSSSTEPAVLVCTDVAARGLDLPDIDLVIEYDAPFSKDDHLHRIGRTARAGRDGRAMIFLQPGCEEGYINILKESKPRNLTRHESDELLRKGFTPSSGVVGPNDWEQKATDFQIEIERWALENPKHLEQARRAYQSHIRAYATHVSAERHIFNMQELHLGHLAKAFALRDKPGSIRVPGSRPGGGAASAKKGKSEANITKKRKVQGNDDEAVTEVDAQEAKRKMQAMSRKMGGVSEFNLG